MVLLKLKGGLGNQMFQYAAAELLGAKMNRSVQLDLSFFKTEKEGVTKRKYCLDLLHSRKLNVINNSGSKLLFKLQYPLLKATTNTLSLQEIEWNKLEYYSRFKNIILDGYFFDLEMLENDRNILGSIFAFNERLFEKGKSLLEEINSCPSVSIHIRRGDYLNSTNARIYHVCGKEYYLEAISYIKSKIKAPSFYIFSDDIEWAQKELRFADTAQYVNVTAENKDVMEFFLMAHCKNNIIANSTYSWWAGYLNKAANKIVVAPKLWYKDENKNKKALGLIPLTWTVL